MPEQPWASGPREILEHALRLLLDDTDSNRRLAMISIDNAVELMLKTYLGLPSRVTGLNLPQREFDEVSQSFPRLLKKVEELSPAKLEGIDLGEIEWFHRKRNALYHNGDGLTIAKSLVEQYASHAKALFQNIFGFPINIIRHSTETEQAVLDKLEAIEGQIDLLDELSLETVKETGAPSNSFLVGIKQHNYGIRIQIFQAQPRRIGRIQGPFRLVDAGNGDYVSAFEPYVGQQFKSAAEMIDAAQKFIPYASHFLNANCLKVEK